MYFHRKNDRKGNPKYVCVYYVDGDKVVQVPRAETKHLDGQSDDNIRYWMGYYASLKGFPVKEPTNVASHPKLRAILDDYYLFLETTQERHFSTIATQRRVLEKHVIPFFMSMSQDCVDPNLWTRYSGQLLEHLVDKGLSKNDQRLCNNALRRLWYFLLIRGKVLNGVEIHLVNPVGLAKRTPLKFALTPEDVLTFARNPVNPDVVRLMALLGYFFSLRPQELFAVQKRFFKADTDGMDFQCCEVMREAGLWDRLVYKVRTQMDSRGSMRPPKWFSEGLVACFNEEAANLIIELLDNCPDLGRVFTYGAYRMYTLWRNQGIKGISLKDLRRASIYWLGHHTTLPPLAIQRHARHAEFASTQKYLRRPADDFDDDDRPTKLRMYS